MKHLYWDDSGVIRSLIKILKESKVVVSTTDTVLGLLVDISEFGHHQLNIIKKREEKPYLIIIADKSKLTRFIQSVTLQIEKLITACWPGPVTLIFKAKDVVSDYMKSKDGTIALRVPDHRGLQKVLQYFDGLFSTSANIAGEPIPQYINQLSEHVINHVAYIVSEKDGVQKIVPSTILDCTGEQIKVIREGAYPIEKLEKVFGAPFKRN